MKRKKLPLITVGNGPLTPMRTSVWVAVFCPSSFRVLLAQRAPTTRNAGQWNFFGGGVDPGERPVKTALRELKEEAGILTTRHNLVILGEAITPAKRNLLFGLPQEDEFAPILNGESTQWQWLHVDDLPLRQDLHLSTSLLAGSLLGWAATFPPPKPLAPLADTESPRDLRHFQWTDLLKI